MTTQTASFDLRSKPEDVLEHLSPLLTVVYEAFEKAVPATQDWFHSRSRSINKQLFPHIVRYEVKYLLDSRGVESTDELPANATLEDIPFNGICIRYEGFCIRVLKAYDSGLPPAGTYTRQQFYQQVLAFPDDVLESGLNLVILWQTQGISGLGELFLSCPKGSNAKAGEAHWQIPIPHPAASSTPAVSALDEEDDLALAMTAAKKTGTDTSE